MQLHITSLVSDGGIWICVGIVHKHLGFGVCIFGRLGLLRGYLVDDRYHTKVNNTGIVKEDAIDGLDASDAFRVKDR